MSVPRFPSSSRGRRWNGLPPIGVSDATEPLVPSFLKPRAGGGLFRAAAGLASFRQLLDHRVIRSTSEVEITGGAFWKRGLLHCLLVLPAQPETGADSACTMQQPCLINLVDGLR